MPKRLTDQETVPVMRAAGLEPLEPYPGSMTKWRCRCLRCGIEVEPKWAQIQQGGGGCRTCGDVALRLSEHEAVSAMNDAGFEPPDFVSIASTLRADQQPCQNGLTSSGQRGASRATPSVVSLGGLVAQHSVR